jgi:hypothetical protein
MQAGTGEEGIGEGRLSTAAATILMRIPHYPVLSAAAGGH